MNKTTPLTHATAISAALMTCTFLAIDHTGAFAQAPVTPPLRAPQQQGRVSVVSPEVQPDRRVTFRLLAPKANEVLFASPDSQGAAMTKGENGVWEVTRGPLEPGPYRYSFTVDGVTVVDPRSPATSEANGSISSLVYVPGADFMDTKNVPHGAVASVTYYSTALSRFRRMHVYTPPGYEQGGTDRFPVLYLLHGSGDSDDSWTSVGRAGFILDNLIAAGKAKPMIVVMPAGHTNSSSFGGPLPVGPRPPADGFEQDFLRDINPTIEKNYRVLTDRPNRAIAGLSMGGNQTLNLAIPHQEKFAYVGVFSSGLFGAFPRSGNATPANAATTARPSWEQQHLAELDNAEWKKGLKLLWFSTGKDDFLVQTTRSTVDLLKKHGFNPVYSETAGGHSWSNWRNYLNEFAPKLFQPAQVAAAQPEAAQPAAVGARAGRARRIGAHRATGTGGRHGRLPGAARGFQNGARKHSSRRTQGRRIRLQNAGHTPAHARLHASRLFSRPQISRALSAPWAWQHQHRMAAGGRADHRRQPAGGRKNAADDHRLPPRECGLDRGRRKPGHP